MHMVGDRTARQPLTGTAGAGPTGLVQQDQDLARALLSLALYQAVLLCAMKGWWLAGVSKQQDFVAVLAAALGPGAGIGITDQQHKVMCQLQCVQVQGNAAVAGHVAGLTARQAALLQCQINGIGVHNADLAQAPQMHREATCKICQVHTRGDGQQGHGDRSWHQVAGIGHRQAPDHLGSQGNGHLGAAGQQIHKLGFGQAHQHRIANRHHRRRARLVGVQAHLPNDFAATHFAQHAFVAMAVLRRDAQSPAD